MDIIIAVVVAIVSAICLCLCLICCCRCCCHKQSARISNKNDDVEKGEPNYPLQQFAIGNEETDGNNKFRSKREYTHIASIYMYNEDEVVERAHSELGTTLWTNDGQVFINHPGNDHAEILFVSNNNYPRQSITTLYIKNSPCHDCATALIKYFKHCPRKPTVYVGRIWHLDDTKDDNGLKDMIGQEFKLQVWDKLHNRMYPGDTTTANYLKRLRNEL